MLYSFKIWESWFQIIYGRPPVVKIVLEELGEIRRSNYWVKTDIHPESQFPNWEPAINFTFINSERLYEYHLHVCSLMGIWLLIWPVWEADKHRFFKERASNLNCNISKLVIHFDKNGQISSPCGGIGKSHHMRNLELYSVRFS